MRPTLLPLIALLTLVAGRIFADTIHPGGFPSPVGPVAEEIDWLYNVIFIIIAVIAFVVAIPILYILWRFRRDKVKKPSTFSHSITLELAWTIIPAIICIYIGVISYHSMVKLRTMPEGAMNVEAVAYQFGWDFYYPDASENGVHVAVPEATENDPEISLPDYARQTKVLVVPVGKPVVVHVTAADVLHAFFVPHLGVKIDATPGRISYTWFEATKAGSYLGQCAELCGQAHGEMFFRVKAVPQEEFDAYIKARRVAAGLPAVHVDAVSETVVSATTATSPSTK